MTREVKKKETRWWHLLRCYLLRDHAWTSRAEQGIPPTEMQLKGGVDGFAEYTEMYCRHCGLPSRLNAKPK